MVIDLIKRIIKWIMNIRGYARIASYRIDSPIILSSQMLTFWFVYKCHGIRGIFDSTGENQRLKPFFVVDRFFCELERPGSKISLSPSPISLYYIILYPPPFLSAKKFSYINPVKKYLLTSSIF